MSWIWLDSKIYPLQQKNNYTVRAKGKSNSYCVAEFKKSFEFKGNVDYIALSVSADSFFMLYANRKLLGIGPAAAGGDFNLTEAAPKHYANLYKIEHPPKKLELFARVRLNPEVLTDYSRGHGGFCLKAIVVYSDKTVESFETDSTWDSRINGSYCDFGRFDNRLNTHYFAPSLVVKDIWNVENAPIPMLDLNFIKSKEMPLQIPSLATKSVRINLKKIYGAYPIIKADGKCAVKLILSELENQHEAEETMYFERADEYVSFKMHSVGTAKLEVKNLSDKPLKIELKFLAPWYPISNEGKFITSNNDFNKIYDVCKHTLKICRQTMHLDSPKHQEPLACTGDYYIETLMTLFCFGDMRLSELDLKRTADILEQNSGVMFHTTYSLIWVQMLLQTFMITGNKELLKYCEKALIMLLDKFESYVGKNNIIDNPPDYMFVDWIVVDGFSLHHPPKALGQTVLNAFYYKALTDAGTIFSFLKNEKQAEYCSRKAKAIKVNINELLFDDEKQLYFDGLLDKESENPPFRPKNANQRYYTKYPNILACLYGIADSTTAKSILERIVNNDMPDIQPYFMHYFLSALRKYDLFEKYGLEIINRWSKVVNECDKGLAEGWIKPEESYYFDHSHAWGGTPAYQLPKAITGLEIIEPGMKKIRLTPNLYNLEFANISIPTVYGEITLELKKGESPIIKVPKEIELI